MTPHTIDVPLSLPLALPAQAVWLAARWTFWPDCPHAPVTCFFCLPQPESAPNVPHRRFIHEAVLSRAQAQQSPHAALLHVFLLSEAEQARHPDLAFNIPLLSKRILAVVEWVRQQPLLCQSPRLGAGVGTATAALIRAAHADPDAFERLLGDGDQADMAGKAPLKGLVPPLCLLMENSPDAAQAARRENVARLFEGSAHQMVFVDPP
jgi:hypothetical protein